MTRLLILALLLASCSTPLPSPAPRPIPSQVTPEPPTMLLETQDPGEIGTAIEAGLATWFDDGAGYYAAVPTWRWGDKRYAIEVCRQDASSVCVTATVRDFCACPGARIVDLSPSAFRRLAPLSVGVVRVTVSDGNRAIPLPATETEEQP